jgi:metal transporter CNNM
VIGQLRVSPERAGDDVVDNDLILVWGEQKRIITGADLLGRLLRGIVAVEGHDAAGHQIGKAAAAVTAQAASQSPASA